MEPHAAIVAQLKAFRWPGGWVPRWAQLDRWLAGHSLPSDTELVKEVGPGHVLFGYAERAILIADQNGATDDCVFFLPDGPAPFAVVHLTWAGTRDCHPHFPSTELISSFAALQPFLDEHPHGI